MQKILISRLFNFTRSRLVCCGIVLVLVTVGFLKLSNGEVGKIILSGLYFTTEANCISIAWSDIKAHDVTTFQPYSKERLVYIRRPKCDNVDFFQEPYAGYCLERQEDGID